MTLLRKSYLINHLVLVFIFQLFQVVARQVCDNSGTDTIAQNIDCSSESITVYQTKTHFNRE